MDSDAKFTIWIIGMMFTFFILVLIVLSFAEYREKKMAIEKNYEQVVVNGEGVRKLIVWQKIKTEK